MLDQDQFAFQLQLLRDEIGEVHKTIDLYDNLSFKVKGWAITVWVGVLGYAIDQMSPWIALLLVPAILAFWLLDAYFKSYQQRSMARMGYIERFINEGIDGPIGSLSAAYEKRSFGSFVIPDPIGRQTRRADADFDAFYRDKTSLRRSLWKRNVRLLYLFLYTATAFAFTLLYVFIGSGT